MILALTESVCVFCVFLQQRNLEGYVGFANLPNQVYRKSVKRGFEFTLMVVGKLGTYTFVPWVRMWMCGSMSVLAQAKPMYAHLPICLHLLVCVCCHFSVSVGHQYRLKGGKACWASSALSCSGWEVDNLKISLCRVVMPCVAWIWKHLPCCSVTENVHMWKVLVVKAGFPQFPRRVFLLTPGRTITHLCVLDDLIWKWAAGCWFKYEWTWLQNVANSITDGGKSTKKWRNCGFGCLHGHTHTYTSYAWVVHWCHSHQMWCCVTARILQYSNLQKLSCCLITCPYSIYLVTSHISLGLLYFYTV